MRERLAADREGVARLETEASEQLWRGEGAVGAEAAGEAGLADVRASAVLPVRDHRAVERVARAHRLQLDEPARSGRAVRPRRGDHGHQLAQLRGRLGADLLEQPLDLGRRRAARLDRQVGGEELPGAVADAGVEARRHPGDRDHRGDADAQADDEEGQPAARAAAVARQPAEPGRSAQDQLRAAAPAMAGSGSRAGSAATVPAPVRTVAPSRSSRTIRPSRRWIRRSAIAATAGSWVTSTRVVPLAPAEVAEHLEDAPAGRAVEVAGGLVGEEQRRPGREGAGERHPLLLAARELRRVVVAALGEADLGQQIVGAPAGAALAGELERQQHVLARGQVAEQLERLEDEADLGRAAGAPAGPPRAPGSARRRGAPRPRSGGRGRRAARAASTCRCPKARGSPPTRPARSPGRPDRGRSAGGRRSAAGGSGGGARGGAEAAMQWWRRRKSSLS